MADTAPTSTYDEVPYLDNAFPQTHPDRLATLGRLFGLQPPDLATCRVLELGCASGANLVPMALGLPNAHFVGVDLSGRQVQQGHQQIEALGLANIELRQYNIADIDASWGKFDYIISHGIYSWVPAPVRERLLAICKENLTDQGIAYVSYNTLPGWHMRGMIRDMMIHHSAGFEDVTAKVAQARGLLDFLARSAPENTPYGLMLRQEANAMRKEADAYLFHEYLEENNQAFYFHEFAGAAARHELIFLAEAELTDMLVSKFPTEVAQTLQRVATDIVRMEQYMDFVRNRMFRQSLLVHQDAPVRRNVDGRSLAGLQLNSVARPESAHPALAQGVNETFKMPDGARQAIFDALTKAALLVMGAQWPRCFAFEELYELTRARLRQEIGDAPIPDDDAKSFGDRMLQAYAARFVELRAAVPRLALTPSERPVASPLVRYQVKNGSTTVTNLRHESIELPELPRQMVMLLDGTRDAEALATEIVKLGHAGKLGIQEESGHVVTDPARREQLLRGLVADHLPKLARVGLLMQ